LKGNSLSPVNSYTDGNSRAFLNPPPYHSDFHYRCGVIAVSLGKLCLATLTTVDVVQIAFVPKVVTAIADHEAKTGFAVTCVYGATKEASQLTQKRTGLLA
jgi:hypothetical protein